MHSRIVVLRILWLLGYCRIGGNNFSGKILEFIGQWISLESLGIQASGLEGPIPSNISLLESLTDFLDYPHQGCLRISDLRGRDTPIPPFSSTTRFKNLDFRFNKLNGSIPIGFAELNRTDSIYLTGNLLSGKVPDWMLTFGDDIDLSYNKFAYNSPPNCHVWGFFYFIVETCLLHLDTIS
ncbi:putative transferase [Helianthus anomalus]